MASGEFPSPQDPTRAPDLFALSNRELADLALQQHSALAMSALATRLQTKSGVSDEEAVLLLEAISKKFETIHALVPKLPDKPASWFTRAFLNTLPKTLALTFLSISGSLYNAINTFVSMGHLIALIPGLVNPVSLSLWTSNPLSATLCLFFVGISAWLFWSFEISLLKQTLNCQNTDQIRAVLDTDNKEIEATRRLNSILTGLTPRERQSKYCQAVMQIAKTSTLRINAKREKYTRGYKEELPHKCLRYFFNVIGGVMNIAGAFFAGQVLLALIAAPLVGTPIGWILLGINILSSIGLYVSKRWNAPHPERKKYNENKEKIDHFLKISAAQKEFLSEQEKNFQKQITHDKRTFEIIQSLKDSETAGEKIKTGKMTSLEATLKYHQEKIRTYEASAERALKQITALDPAWPTHENDSSEKSSPRLLPATADKSLHSPTHAPQSLFPFRTPDEVKSSGPHVKDSFTVELKVVHSQDVYSHMRG